MNTLRLVELTKDERMTDSIGVSSMLFFREQCSGEMPVLLKHA